MSMTMTLLATSEPVLLAATETESSGGEWLWLLGPAAGAGFYLVTYLRYRNVDKRHAYERETACTVEGMTTHDSRTGRVTDVENSRLRGDNVGSPRDRLGAKSTWSEQ